MGKLDRLLFPEANSRLSRDVARMQRWRNRGRPRLATLMSRLMQRRYGVFISPLARLGKGVMFPHPTGIVIGEGVVIGDRVTIYQNVTLGGARIGDWQKNNYPEIGAGSVIFAGAVILGRIRVGIDCIIGANSVVLRDVPDGATAVGAPARLLRRKAPDDVDASPPAPATPAPEAPATGSADPVLRPAGFPSPKLHPSGSALPGSTMPESMIPESTIPGPGPSPSGSPSPRTPDFLPAPDDAPISRD